MCHIREDSSIIWWSKSRHLFEQSASVMGSLQINNVRLVFKTIKRGLDTAVEVIQSWSHQISNFPSMWLAECVVPTPQSFGSPPIPCLLYAWKHFAFLGPNEVNEPFWLISLEVQNESCFVFLISAAKPLLSWTEKVFLHYVTIHKRGEKLSNYVCGLLH